MIFNIQIGKVSDSGKNGTIPLLSIISSTCGVRNKTREAQIYQKATAVPFNSFTILLLKSFLYYFIKMASTVTERVAVRGAPAELAPLQPSLEPEQS